MRIAVLMGGYSPEREVSLASGEAIASALERKSHEVLRLDPALGPEEGLYAPRSVRARLGSEPPGLDELPRDAERTIVRTLEWLSDQAVDAVFVALHGGAGEDGRVQAVLEMVGLPYTGSGPLASALAMTKSVAKSLFERSGVRTPQWILLPNSIPAEEAAKRVHAEFSLPVVVKPDNQGSTVGFSLVRSPEDISPALERAWQYGDALVEPFIEGREVTVAILDGRALPVLEIVPEHGVYDYECKYTKGKSRYLVPAEVPEAVAHELQDQAVRAYRALGCRDYARADFRLRTDDVPFCLEINTAPGMTELSLVPKAARAAGISFEDLCDRIVRMAAARGRN